MMLGTTTDGNYSTAAVFQPAPRQDRDRPTPPSAVDAVSNGLLHRYSSNSPGANGRHLQEGWTGGAKRTATASRPSGISMRELERRESDTNGARPALEGGRVKVVRTVAALRDALAPARRSGTI